jgi:glucokinase
MERAIGVDVGGTKIVIALVGRDGAIVRRERRATALDSADALLAQLAAGVESVRDETVRAVGIGIPSTIDRRTGRAAFSVNIPLADLDAGTWARETFGLPTAIDNDGNCAAFAEWRFGAGRGVSDLVMLTLGTGIGGGLILGGRPYRGWIGAGAELGHMVVSLDGPRCQGACTGRGHLERLASGEAVGEIARGLLGPGADAHALIGAARAGDEQARAALTRIGRLLGAGSATLVNVLNPELIVVGGGLGDAFDLLVGGMREIVARDAQAPARDVVRIVPAALGADAGVIGAALAGFEALDNVAKASAG